MSYTFQNQLPLRASPFFFSRWCPDISRMHLHLSLAFVRRESKSERRVSESASQVNVPVGNRQDWCSWDGPVTKQERGEINRRLGNSFHARLGSGLTSSRWEHPRRGQVVRLNTTPPNRFVSFQSSLVTSELPTCSK